MQDIEFAIKKGQSLNILCLGAHSDDIEIGCGGSILRLLNEYDQLHVYWVVFAANHVRQAEAEQSANLFLAKATRKDIIIRNFRESFFPYIGIEIKEYFESLKNEFKPDIIFTHYRHDLHQDHRLISDLTWQTFRNHLILEYEIIKYDGDLGVPNFFVHLNEKICKKKIDYLMEFFKTQTNKDWFTPDAFFSILRIRGIESKAPEKYAEGFYSRKVII